MVSKSSRGHSRKVNSANEEKNGHRYHDEKKEETVTIKLNLNKMGVGSSINHQIEREGQKGEMQNKKIDKFT